MYWDVQPDWRDKRMAELETVLSKRDARIAELERQVEALTRQVADLLGLQAQPARKRGGQPGHQGAHRAIMALLTGVYHLGRRDHFLDLPAQFIHAGVRHANSIA